MPFETFQFFLSPTMFWTEKSTGTFLANLPQPFLFHPETVPSFTALQQKCFTPPKRGSLNDMPVS